MIKLVFWNVFKIWMSIFIYSNFLKYLVYSQKKWIRNPPKLLIQIRQLEGLGWERRGGNGMEGEGLLNFPIIFQKTWAEPGNPSLVLIKLNNIYFMYMFGKICLHFTQGYQYNTLSVFTWKPSYEAWNWWTL